MAPHIFSLSEIIANDKIFQNKIDHYLFQRKKSAFNSALSPDDSFLLLHSEEEPYKVTIRPSVANLEHLL